MKPNYLIHPLQFSALALLGTLLSQTNPALSQIIPDNTLGAESSVINPRDEISDSIDGGALRGQNLFHSFQEFNVDAGRGVYFTNPDAVDNIFSRVTGNNVSNILGTLGVDGAADLYLINPNGIIFGENAALDIQGSFTATTAEGIEFSEGGLFSAVAPGESLLTISVPLGLQFGSTPGNIINRSFVRDETGNFVGLQAPDGENLTLVGGDISFEAGEATARGGNIFIGGLSEAGIVALSEDGNLRFPEDLARADVLFSNAADVDVRGTGGGSISIDAQNVNIEAGEFGSSQIRAGIAVDSTSPEAQAGDITINAIGIVNLVDESKIQNRVEVGAIGNSGDIELTAESLNLSNAATLDTRTSGVGNAGDIYIEAEEMTFSGSTIVTEVSSDGGIGNAGDIDITTNSLLLQNGSFFLADTENQGDAGNILIEAADFVVLEGLDEDDFPSQITSTVDASSNLDVTGNAGNIEINAGSLTIRDRGFISTDTSGKGDGGSILINATENITIYDSSILSRVNFLGIGNAGNIEITAGSLDLSNGGTINASSFGTGNSGHISLLALEDINLGDNVSIDASIEGEGTGGNILVSTQGNLLLGNAANITSNIPMGAIGQGGDIDIQAGSFILDDAFLDISTFGQGDAGKIDINVDNSFVLQSSNIYNNSEQEAIGNTGGIKIEAKSLSLEEDSNILNQIIGSALVEGGGIQINANSLSLDSDESLIDSSVFGQGQAGDILINAKDSVSLVGDAKLFEPDFATAILTRIQPGGEGSAGNITINTNSLSISGAQISASVQGEGEAGNISIKAGDSVAIFNESGIFSSVDSGAVGLGGDINIDSNSLSINDGSQISSIVRGFSELNPIPGKGEAGDININVKDSLSISGLLLEEGTTTGFIATSVTPGAEGIGGDINIKAGDVILNNFASLSSSLDPEAIGEAGNINIEANSFSLSNGQIKAVTEGTGQAGNIHIDTEEFVSLVDSSILSSALGIAKGSGGDIQLNTSSLFLKDDSSIDAVTSSVNSIAGNINVNASDITLRNDSDISTLASQNFGEGGNITLTADSIIAFDDSDIFAFAADGQGGNITLNTPAFFAENFTLNSLTANPDGLDLNNRADVNATGAVSGAVSIPDVSFIQNSLTELPDNSLNTDELVANSCVVPAGNRSQGKFIITGSEGLPVRPGENLTSKYPTGEVRGLSEDNTRSWQPGDPIVEPQRVYRLANGKLVLSRECSSQ